LLENNSHGRSRGSTQVSASESRTGLPIQTLFLRIYMEKMGGMLGGFMDATIEKRACERRACDLPIVWCYFNQNQFHKAKLLNYCEGGIYLETATAPRSGATILIKRRHPTTEKYSGKLYEGHREITLAEVRWCCEAREAIGCHYRVGASYLSIGYP
jgi:hypothetical protein